MSGLHDLISTVAEELPAAHPRDVAVVVAERTDPDDVFTFYVTALERVVCDRIRISRNATLNSKTSRSPKLEQRRAWWQRVLEQRVHVGESKYKPLRDCTVENLLFCINERRDQIGALEGQVEKFEAIVAAMQSHGVATAGELPNGAVEL